MCVCVHARPGVFSCVCVCARVCVCLCLCVDAFQSVPLEDPEGSAEVCDNSGLNREEVMRLIGVLEPSLSFLLLQLIKLSSKRKSR